MKYTRNRETTQNVSILLLTEQVCPFGASDEASDMTGALAKGESCCRAF
jgi:hypothetical protein